MRRFRIPLIFTAAGLLTGLAILYLRPAEYVSRATLRIAPAVVPERYVPGVPTINSTELLRHSVSAIFSRGVCTTLIQLFDLYPAERRRMPMEDVIEIFRKRVLVQAPVNNIVTVEFTYDDRYKVQKVVSEITTRILDMSIREGTLGQYATSGLLSDEAEAAGTRWTRYNEQIRQAPGKADERLLLDRDLARKEYIDLKAKVADARLVDQLVKRQLANRLEVEDPASLPVSPRDNPYVIPSIATLAGLALGLVVRFAMRLRPLRLPHPVTA